jgi:hypothetical protein
LVGPDAAGASEIVLTTSNDILSGNRFTDDRYTAALGLGLDFRRFGVEFQENLFTDRDHGLRFDETWLTVQLQPRIVGPWRPTLEVGAVHVGKGLLGESAQNAIHRAIGGEDVDVPYLEHETVHAVARVEMRRTLHASDRFDLEVSFGGTWSPAFRSTLETELDAAVPLTRWLTVLLGVGGRLDRTELDALEPWQHDTAMTGRLGFLFARRLELSWTYNQYGTGARHVMLGWRIPTSHGERGAR